VLVLTGRVLAELSLELLDATGERLATVVGERLLEPCEAPPRGRGDAL
jgi:hypothetical protein